MTNNCRLSPTGTGHVSHLAAKDLSIGRCVCLTSTWTLACSADSTSNRPTSTKSSEPNTAVWCRKSNNRSLRMAVLCALLGGCTPPILRMSSAFDGAPLGATLDTNPPPNPPEDSFVWVKAHTTSTLVKRPGTLLGGWARIAPNQSFLAAPEMREQVLLGYTERLTAAPPATLRGEVTVRLDGYGRLDFLLAAANTKNIPGDFLGGFVVDVPSLTPQSGVVLAVSSFSQERIRDISPLPSRNWRSLCIFKALARTPSPSLTTSSSRRFR